MPVTDHLPRTLGPYRLQDRLGEGGMGVVHLARDPEGRAVAVKVPHPLGSEGVNARRRLAREVETMRLAVYDDGAAMITHVAILPPPEMLPVPVRMTS